MDPCQLQATPSTIKDALTHASRLLGFLSCKIAPANSASRLHASEFNQWLDSGAHASMLWIERGREKRLDPDLVLPGCKSVISLAYNYNPGPQPHSTPWRIAKYSWHEDYHDLLAPKLEDLAELLSLYGGSQRVYTDTGPILERDWASLAGNGWTGKSCMQILPGHGGMFFLSEIFTTLELPADSPSPNRCGSCQRCIVACPTAAITSPYHLDPRLCLSYWTIENPGPIPLHIRPLLGNRIYGCDECLDACPWNRFAETTREHRLMAKPELFRLDWQDLFSLDTTSFNRIFARSPIRRIKLPALLRNACVAFGNSATREMLPLLNTMLVYPDGMVAEHAQWARLQILSRGQTLQTDIGA